MKKTKLKSAILFTAEVFGWRMLAGVILAAVCFLSILINISFCGTFTQKSSALSENTIESNIETLALLQEDTWSDLSMTDRIDVLQTVADIEAAYWGLPHKLTVITSHTPENILGHYIDHIHTITIGTNHLQHGNPRDILETLTHEAYHAYEYRLADVYEDVSDAHKNLWLLNRAKVYSEELNNYTNSEDDLIGYLFQIVEFDSEAYSIAAVERYYDAINTYLNNTLH